MSPNDPEKGPRRSTPVRLALRGVAGLVLIAAVIATAQTVSVLRTRGIGLVQGSLMDRAMVDFDVVGTGELMFLSGATSGMLRGKSYTELPTLFLPRRVIGDAKPSHIAADAVMRDYTQSNAGLAAPLWLEPALNFGRTGVFVYMLLFSACVVWFLRRGHWSHMWQFGGTVALLGPLWIAVIYLIFSRLTTYQMLLTLGTAFLGCYAASKCIEWKPGTPTDPAAERRDHAYVNGVPRNGREREYRPIGVPSV
jgi:hypothetical protein